MYWIKPSLICIFFYVTTTTSQLDSDILPTEDVCGKGAFDKIYGGEQTGLTEFPWMALLEYDLPYSKNKFRCGGSLITKRHVLTAAHCIKSSLISVRLGEHNLKTDPDCDDTTPGFEDCAEPHKDIGIEEKFVFATYRSGDINHHGDIAILKLKEDVDFTENIAPICLPLSEELKNEPYTGKKLTVAGWGKTENSSYSDVKLKVEVPVISGVRCSETYSAGKVNLLGSQLCAGAEEGKDSCNGDSGGPLMYRHITTKNEHWYVIGVVSFGPNRCGLKDWPGIYTRVPHFTEWILDTLKL